MADLYTVLTKAMELNWNICSLLRLSTFKNYDGLSGLTVNYEDGEQIKLRRYRAPTTAVQIQI